MTVGEAGGGGAALIVRLEPGDDVLLSIEVVCREHDVANAEVTGIGSVESLTLAHYRRDTKRFTQQRLDGIWEVVALVGNVGLVDGRSTVHCHVTVSDAAMTPRAGHLVSAVCSATVELVIRPLGSRYEKRLDEAVGLKVWRLD